ncbi:MAG: DeoR/GlpR transcriptional regulator [Clostridia bacterium]|nr:DeoR/GlpR transcriptional regulator [Clostridia bacterium]
MLAEERQNKIYKIIQDKGAVTVSYLISTFNVSIETVRRDLMAMENQGKLVRVHGGAVANGDMKNYSDLKKRNNEYSSQKNELAIKAAEFVNDGDIIAIDSGSTALMFAEALKLKNFNLTILTHSEDVFNSLRNHGQFTLILCGGYYMNSENAFYGELTIDMLRNLHVKKSFIFPSAISLEGGICDYQNDLLQVQKQLLKCADEIYVLADSSKFEKRALHKLEDMKREYIYVTDSGLSYELKKVYEENNIKIFDGKDK